MDNIIAGGNFDTNPWLYGTNFPSIVAGSHTASMWQTNFVSSGNVKVTMAKVADAPTMAQAGYLTNYSLGLTVTTATPSPGPNDIFYNLQYIEGYNFLPIAQQESVISFWVKATVPGTYSFVSHNYGADQSFIGEYTVNNSLTWEFKSVVVPPSPVAGTWNYASGTGITLQFLMQSPSKYFGVPGWQSGGVYSTSSQPNVLATVNNIWRIALVKWEKGNVATPYKGRSIQEEVMLCTPY
jgi:hypothetical protein